MENTLSNAIDVVKHLLVSHPLKMRFNPCMDMHALRRKNLGEFIKSCGKNGRAGTPVEFSEKYGISEGRISQLLSETYRNGNGFGEKAARKIETIIGKPALWLDRLEGDADLESTSLRPMTDEQRELLMLWEQLLPDQRTTVLSDIRKHAEYNVALIEQLRAKERAASQDGIAHRTIIVSDRRKSQIPFSHAERREKDGN